MAVALAPDAEIHLIHAYQVPFEGFLYGAESREQLEGDLKERMEAMIDKEMSVSLASLGIDKSKLHRVLKHGAIRQVIGARGRTDQARSPGARDSRQDGRRERDSR